MLALLTVTAAEAFAAFAQGTAITVSIYGLVQGVKKRK